MMAGRALPDRRQRSRAGAAAVFGVAALAAACSNGSGPPQGGGPADPSSVQDPSVSTSQPPSNDQAPPSDTQEAPANTQAPPANTQAPGAPGPGSTTTASGEDQTCLGACPNVVAPCVPICVDVCLRGVAITSDCPLPSQALLQCAAQNDLLCRRDGRIDLSNLNDCLQAAVDAVTCLGEHVRVSTKIQNP